MNRAILTAGNPEGDVLFGVDDNLFPKAVEEGVFEPYESPELSRVDDAYELDPTHAVTPVDHGDVCLNVDLGWFGERLPPPGDLGDLTEGRYRGLTVVENPATSTPGLAFMLATIARFGDDGWQAFWRDLRANDVLVVDGWEQAYFGEFSGRAAGGRASDRGVVRDEPGRRGGLRRGTARSGADRRGHRELLPPGGVRRRARRHRTPREARAVIDFLLSRRFQEDVPLRMFVFPVVGDAELPEEFVRWAEEPESPLALPPEQVSAEREAWVQTWTDLMLG